jgi:hypothetical protein
VATRQWILALALAAMTAVLTACSGNSNTQNPPPPPPSKVSIAFQPEPGGTLSVGFSENITAVVTNDPSNDGVDWSLTCQNPTNCGSLSVLHTASGVPTTYTAPTSISTNSTVVEILALATTEQTKNVVAPVTVTTFNSGLQPGTYILQAQGVDPNLNPYQIDAAVVLDGSGNITGGEQTANIGLTNLSDVNLTGNYFLGNDGRGTMAINTNDVNIGQNGVETFAFIYLSPSQSLISQIDIAPAQTGVSATGTLDLQTSTTAPSGGYAFAVNGFDVVKFLPVAFGGILNIDSPNTISGSGSTTDEILAKKLNAADLPISGVLTAPDQYGAFTLNLTAPFGATNKSIPLQFTGYIIDDTHIKLIETDTVSTNLTPFAVTGGLAIGQGSAAGTFTGDKSFSGTYVFSVPGVDLSEANTLPSTLTSVGVFTADGKGNLNGGFTDTFLQLNCAQLTCTQDGIPGAQISAAFDGNYTVEKTGRASLAFADFNPDPRHVYTPTLFFYLTGIGNPPLVLEGGDANYPSLGTGIAFAQSTTPSAFTGPYGFSFTQQNGSEVDGTAQMNADATATPPSLSGIADVNLEATPALDQPFLGTFSVPQSNGIFPVTLVGNNNGSSSSAVFTPQITANFYAIDPGHGFLVETDLIVQGAQQNGQVSTGYYAARAPLCEGCP